MLASVLGRLLCGEREDNGGNGATRGYCMLSGCPEAGRKSVFGLWRHLALQDKHASTKGVFKGVIL